jgi:ribosomal protein S4E
MKPNAIFDYYEMAVKTSLDILKVLKENKKYLDVNDGNPMVRSSEDVLLVIHSINRISLIPANPDKKVFFLSGAHINKEGEVIHTSNCHGGVMKRYKNIKKMITQFNKNLKCESLKIKTIINQDGHIIQLPQ